MKITAREPGPTVKMRFWDDRDPRGARVVAELGSAADGRLFVRKPRRLWEAVHPCAGRTVSEYSAKVKENFGWRAERVG